MPGFQGLEGVGRGVEDDGQLVIQVVSGGRGDSAQARWCDIRPQLGATSTIVLQYLREKNIPVDASLATALIPGAPPAIIVAADGDAA